MDFEKVSSLHNSHDIPFSISKEMHAEIFNSFDRYDKFLLKFGLLSNTGYWQVLLDKDKNPANKPPWGGMAKIDLVSGKKLWDIPLGQRLDSNSNLLAKGDIVFGGILVTASGLIFATGNPDGAAYAFDTNGKKVWQDFLPFAGSAPPMTYTFNNCQYVVFVATGGRFVEFKENGNGDYVEVYKLDSCKPKN
jgi:quinoprotein glucose dehydrogenase